MIEDWAARILCLVASIIIVALSEQRLNLMSPCTRPGFRLAFLGLTVGGAWQIIDLLAGDVPTWSVVAVRVGLALLLIEERHCPRACLRAQEQKPVKVHRRTHSRRHDDDHSITDPPGV